MEFDHLAFLIFIYTSIIILCAFSIIYLGSVHWKKNKWLLVAYFGLGWTFLHLLLGPEGYGLSKATTITQNPASLLLFPVGLYLYVSDLIELKKTSSKILFLHFIPFFFFQLLFSITEMSTLSAIFDNDFQWTFFLFIISMLIIGIVYSYLTLRLVKINHQKYKNVYADVNPFITLDWIKWMIFIMLIFFFLGITALFVLPIYTEFPAIGITFSSVLLICLTLSYFSFRQPILYHQSVDSQKNNNSNEEIENLAKDTKSIIPSNPISKNNISLSVIEKEKLITQIEQHMTEDKPFLNPKIRMPELAKTLEIPRYIFSYLINEHYHVNFFQFINQYRIDHAKNLLIAKENQHYTLESISQMSGFNSRSTFNTRFKEIVGKSPKEYKQKK